MLIEFTVENYRSFYSKKTLVMEADKAIKECSDSNLFNCNKYTLLRSLALYGANSSGTSNMVSAMHTMTGCVLLSVKLNDNDELEYDPFLLLKDNCRPTMFEVVFLRYVIIAMQCRKKAQKETFFLKKVSIVCL